MTLEQSEYQRLVELLLELLERYRGELHTLEAILSELRDLYKKVPIYPGIITLCLPKVVQPAQVDKLKEGDEVVLSLKDGRMLSGKLAEVNSNEIKLAECRQLNVSSLAEKIPVQKGEVEEVRVIVRNILEKEWPSLDFEEE